MTIKAFWNRVKKLIKAHNMPQQQNPCLASIKCRFAGSAAAVTKLTVVYLKQKPLSSRQTASPRSGARRAGSVCGKTSGIPRRSETCNKVTTLRANKITSLKIRKAFFDAFSLLF
jgi:hypothetical protein